jgi:hypothetical protein
MESSLLDLKLKFQGLIILLSKNLVFIHHVRSSQQVTMISQIFLGDSLDANKVLNCPVFFIFSQEHSPIINLND